MCVCVIAERKKDKQRILIGKKVKTDGPFKKCKLLLFMCNGVEDYKILQEHILMGFCVKTQTFEKRFLPAKKRNGI